MRDADAEPGSADTEPSDPLALRLAAKTGADSLRVIAEETSARTTDITRRLAGLARLHGAAWAEAQARLQADLTVLADAFATADPLHLAAQGRDWWADALQRTALTLDTLRSAADTARMREDAGLKPVLAFDYEVVIEGKSLPRPVNYTLMRIRPPRKLSRPAPLDHHRPPLGPG